MISLYLCAAMETTPSTPSALRPVRGLHTAYRPLQTVDIEGELRGRIGALERDIARMNAQILELEDQEQKILGENTTLLEEKSQNEAALGSQRATLETQDAELARLSGLLKLNQKELDQRAEAIRTQEGELARLSTLVKSKDADLGKQIQEAKKEKDRLEQALLDLTTERDALQATIRTLTEQSRRLQARYQELERKNLELTEQMERLNAEQLEQGGRSETFQAALKATMAQLDAAQGQLRRLRLSLNEAGRGIIHLSKVAMETIITYPDRARKDKAQFEAEKQTVREEGGNPISLVRAQIEALSTLAGYREDIDAQKRNERIIYIIDDLTPYQGVQPGSIKFLIALNDEEKGRIFDENNMFKAKKDPKRFYSIQARYVMQFADLENQIAAVNFEIPAEVIPTVRQNIMRPVLEYMKMLGETQHGREIRKEAQDVIVNAILEASPDAPIAESKLGAVVDAALRLTKQGQGQEQVVQAVRDVLASS